MIRQTPFSDGLTRLAADLKTVSPCALVWKAADPDHWDQTPVSLGQHRHPHCLAIKRDPARREICKAHDNLTEKDLPKGPSPCLRTCPYGVTDLMVPIYSGGRYMGLLELGGWRGPKGPKTLPPFPGYKKARALGRLAQGGLAPLMPLVAVDDTYRAAKQDPLMYQAVIYIGEHLGAGLRAAEVARAADLSVSRFLHRFKEATGETFHRHTVNRLMAEACRRLMSSPASVESIALDLGYRDGAAFNLAFRRALGLPPGQWRREQMPKNEP